MPQDATFPILKQLDGGNWQVIGTAFFISKHGIFLTATHVLREVLDQQGQQINPIAAFIFLPENNFLIRRVLKGFFGTGDVAAGILENNQDSTLTNHHYTLSYTRRKKGDPIFTCAYPETKHSGNEIDFKLNFYSGQIEDHYSNGRDKMLPNPCYQTTMHIKSGASGGPVFFKGQVTGINSSAFNFSDDDSPVSFISDINGIFNIVIEDIFIPSIGHIKNCTLQELLTLQNINFYGPSLICPISSCAPPAIMLIEKLL